MASQPPFILADNVYDRINLYPLATISASDPGLPGRGVQFVADYRRERTYYQRSAAGVFNEIRSDLGAGNSAIVDTCWIDRGHNLWGKTVIVLTTDNAAYDPPVHSFAFVVPALGTVGGDPTTGWCVTEEGALYTIFSGWTARRYFDVYVNESHQAIFTGIVLGKRVQLSSPAGYSSVLDEDAGERTERNEASLVPGYEGADRTYSARKVELRLAYIGATEYDAAIRGLRRTLYEVGQAAVVCMNYGTKPERAWLYKYRGKDWSSPLTRAYRNVNIPLFEYGPLIR